MPGPTTVCWPQIHRRRDFDGKFSWQVGILRPRKGGRSKQLPVFDKAGDTLRKPNQPARCPHRLSGELLMHGAGARGAGARLND